MQQYAKRVWVAVGAVSVVLLGAWLVSRLLYGLLVIFAGILVGVVLAKLSTLVSRTGRLSYNLAYGGVVTGIAALAFGLFWLLGTNVAMQAGKFVRQLRESGTQLEQRLSEQPWWSEVQSASTSAMDLLASKQAVSTATSAVSITFSAIGGAVLVVFLGIYFAVWPERYRAGLLSLVPPRRRKRVGEVTDTISTALWYWILGRCMGMLIIGVGTWLGLWLLGVPLPMSLAVLAGMMTFVPNIGPLIALVPAVLFSLQIGTDTALYVIAFYFGLQTVESYLLTPMIDQYQVAVPPGLTLSAQLLFGLVGGLLGLVLATPLVVVISLLLREFYVRDILEAEPLRE